LASINSAIQVFLGGLSPTAQGVLAVFITVWSIVWKGLALWRSARKEHKYWFIALLVINTLGLLEILYLFVFSKKKKK